MTGWDIEGFGFGKLCGIDEHIIMTTVFEFVILIHRHCSSCKVGLCSYKGISKGLEYLIIE